MACGSLCIVWYSWTWFVCMQYVHMRVVLCSSFLKGNFTSRGEKPPHAEVSLIEVSITGCVSRPFTCRWLLNSYLINLVHLILGKSEGKPIAGLPNIDRLVEIRTVSEKINWCVLVVSGCVCIYVWLKVMEKIRPLEHKLHYQVDKLIKIASTSAACKVTFSAVFSCNLWFLFY